MTIYLLTILTSLYRLFQILGIIAGCLLQDHEEHGSNFQQLPYHRLLLILFLDMNMAEPVLESMNYQVIVSISNYLHSLVLIFEK